jgi:hypothetical protein
MGVKEKQESRIDGGGGGKGTQRPVLKALKDGCAQGDQSLLVFKYKTLGKWTMDISWCFARTEK